MSNNRLSPGGPLIPIYILICYCDIGISQFFLLVWNLAHKSSFLEVNKHHKILFSVLKVTIFQHNNMLCYRQTSENLKSIKLSESGNMGGLVMAVICGLLDVTITSTMVLLKLHKYIYKHTISWNLLSSLIYSMFRSIFNNFLTFLTMQDGQDLIKLDSSVWYTVWSSDGICVLQGYMYT